MIISTTILKEYLKLTTTDTNRDAFLEKVSARAQSIIEGTSCCNRHFEDVAYAEYYNGDGTSLLFIKNYPIIDITGITIDDTAMNAEDLDDRDVLRWNDKTGGVYLMNGYFAAGFQNVLVAYQAGYTAGNEPDQIVEAIIELAAIIYKESDYGDGMLVKGSVSLPQGGSQSFLHKMNSETYRAVMGLRRVVL